jgi:hypothetical protein
MQGIEPCRQAFGVPTATLAVIPNEVNTGIEPVSNVYKTLVLPLN